MPITPAKIIGLRCTFDHDGKPLTGVVADAKDNGHAEPGHIPDLLVTVRGQSGRTVTVSMTNSYMQFPDL